MLSISILVYKLISFIKVVQPQALV